MTRSGRGRLARLDDRAVPTLASGLRGIGRAARSSGRATGPIGRWTSRFARSQPTVLAAVLTVAAAGVLWAATGGNPPKSVRPLAASVVPPLTGAELGPAPGTTVDAYRADAALRRQQLAALPANQQLTALVDLTGYLTPQAIATLLAGQPEVKIVRGFAQVPPPAAAAIHILTVGVGGDLATQLGADQAAAKQLLSRYTLALEARAAHPHKAQLNELVLAQLPQVPAARVDANGLGPTCGCVFALLVTGPVNELSQIATLTDVRVLDPAPPSTPVDQLTVLPLEPQVTGTVEPLQFAGV